MNYTRTVNFLREQKIKGITHSHFVEHLLYHMNSITCRSVKQIDITTMQFKHQLCHSALQVSIYKLTEEDTTAYIQYNILL